ncbi:MAG: winged helix-turn-helix transcriptional regulator [Candidatus Hodarchaeota archaeon]
MGNNALPNSAKEVLSCIVESPKGICPNEIISQTAMSPRTVRYALRQLLEKDIVEVKATLEDMRKRRYYVKPNFLLDYQFRELLR